MRIPVTLTPTSKPAPPAPEQTVIEFGTSREVLFSSHLPLEFADTVRVRNADQTLDAEAFVVALQQRRQSCNSRDPRPTIT